MQRLKDEVATQEGKDTYKSKNMVCKFQTRSRIDKSSNTGVSNINKMLIENMTIDIIDAEICYFKEENRETREEIVE